MMLDLRWRSAWVIMWFEITTIGMGLTISPESAKDAGLTHRLFI